MLCCAAALAWAPATAVSWQFHACHHACQLAWLSACRCSTEMKCVPLFFGRSLPRRAMNRNAVLSSACLPAGSSFLFLGHLLLSPALV